MYISMYLYQNRTKPKIQYYFIGIPTYIPTGWLNINIQTYNIISQCE